MLWIPAPGSLLSESIYMLAHAYQLGVLIPPGQPTTKVQRNLPPTPTLKNIRSKSEPGWPSHAPPNNITSLNTQQQRPDLILLAYEYGSLRQETYLRLFYLPSTRNMHETIRDWPILLHYIHLDP